MHKKTRDQIIESMCLTWRHDYGLAKGRFSGMTEEERQELRKRMGQLFDNDIAPNMDFKESVHDGVIKVDSFSFSDCEKAAMSSLLKRGSETVSEPDCSWNKWLSNRWFGIR